MITGAASGMGAACARRFSVDHGGLFLLDLDVDGLRRASRDVGDGTVVETHRGDVSSPEDVRTAVASCLDRFGRIDILVHAAGTLKPTRLLDLSVEEWRRTIDVNLTGTFLVTKEVAHHMRHRGWGRIVHFSSTAGKTVSTLGGSHYTAAKHGVLGLTRAAAKELAPFGITVNAVCPGLVDTEMVRRSTTEEQRTAYADGFPISRLAEPGEVAELVHFVAGDGAAYITGAALDINGGDLMV